MIRELTVNMPHMAIGGLSESWLFRELGDMHWMGICEGLATKSDTIADDLGNRLYATFVRFRWEGADHLQTFRENDRLRLGSTVSRYGASMFFSECTVTGAHAEVRARLMTTFALRQSSNTTLLKGQPAIPPNSPVAVEAALPPFAADYRAQRKEATRPLELCGVSLQLGTTPLGEMLYRLNPYLDFNGVNLLYFAAYPSIADFCEREFIHTHPQVYRVSQDWALESSTLGRDVFYYGNCNIDDRVLFQLDTFRRVDDHRVASIATLYRESDHERLCNVFTVKAIHG
jgi:probable biosynthetic protein (TIGR04098 family)